MGPACAATGPTFSKSPAHTLVDRCRCKWKHTCGCLAKKMAGAPAPAPLCISLLEEVVSDLCLVVAARFAYLCKFMCGGIRVTPHTLRTLRSLSSCATAANKNSLHRPSHITNGPTRAWAADLMVIGRTLWPTEL